MSSQTSGRLRQARSLSIATTFFAVIGFAAFCVPLVDKSSFLGPAHAAKALTVLLVFYIGISIAALFAIFQLFDLLGAAFRPHERACSLLDAAVACAVLAGVIWVLLLSQGVAGAAKRTTSGPHPDLVSAGKVAAPVLTALAAIAAAGLIVILLVRSARHLPLKEIAIAATIAAVWASAAVIGLAASSGRSSQTVAAGVYSSIFKSTKKYTAGHPPKVTTPTNPSPSDQPQTSTVGRVAQPTPAPRSGPPSTDCRWSTYDDGYSGTLYVPYPGPPHCYLSSSQDGSNDPYCRYMVGSAGPYTGVPGRIINMTSWDERPYPAHNELEYIAQFSNATPLVIICAFTGHTLADQPGPVSGPDW